MIMYCLNSVHVFGNLQLIPAKIGQKVASNMSTKIGIFISQWKLIVRVEQFLRDLLEFEI